MSRLPLLQQTAAIIGVPLSSVLELGEGSSVEPRGPGAAGPRRSEPVTNWTPNDLEVLEKTSQVMGIPFSRLIRYAETTSPRYRSDGVGRAQSASGTQSDWAGNEDVSASDEWSIPNGVPNQFEPFGTFEGALTKERSVESEGSSANSAAMWQVLMPQRNITPPDGLYWSSHYNNAQNDPWNAVSSSQSQIHAFDPATHTWTFPSGGTDDKPHFTPMGSSRGSSAARRDHSYSHITSDGGSPCSNAPQDLEHLTRGAGMGQGLDLLGTTTRHAAVQTEDGAGIFHQIYFKPDHDFQTPPMLEFKAPTALRKRSRATVGGGDDPPEGSQTGARKGGKSRPFPFTKCLRCSRDKKQCVPMQQQPLCCERCAGMRGPHSGLGCIYFTLQNVVLFRTTTDPASRKPYKEMMREQRLLEPALRAVKSTSCPDICFRVSQGPAWLSLSAKAFDQTAVQASVSPGFHSLYSHPFALTEGAKKTVEQFLWQNWGRYLNCYANRCELDKTVFRAACAAVKKQSDSMPQSSRSLILTALHFWSAARTIEGGWLFAPDQMLGLQSPDGGPAKLTSAPFIDYQISGIMMDILQPLRESVLDKLERLTRGKDPRHWYTIFLVTYILLQSYGLLAKQQARFAQRRGSKARFTLMGLMVDIQEGSQKLLCFFHEVCKGKSPTQIDWEDASKYKNIAWLSTEQAETMASISNHITDNDLLERFKSIPPSGFDEDFFFTGQMFAILWKPKNPLVTLPIEP